jgi:diguanylate cyclase (GGDEF)-like protein
MRLLLIDDDEVDRQMVIRLLRGSRAPIDIVQATTGASGLELFEASRFDAVLLDYMLPDMTGLEVLRSLVRDTQRRAGVIMLTGGAHNDLELTCLEAGAQDFLLKQDITDRHLERALVHARARHKLEMKLIESHEHLRVLAESDPLTSLANRYFFDKTLRTALSRIQRQGEKLALLLLDLDRFKLVNDNLGHDIGDRLLVEVASRLLQTTRASDVVCRLGGDEFAILTSCVEVETTMACLAERVQEVFCQKLRIEGHDLAISASIGIAIAPQDGASAEALLKSADLAMYEAKRAGRNRCRFFFASFEIAASRKAMIEKELRAADITSQLRLFYQPLVSAATREVCGAEALIRWQNPQRGLLQPGAFLDVAEECGLMEMIDAWSRRHACRQMAAWFAQGMVPPGFTMSFNVSAATLRQEGLEQAIRRDVEDAELPVESMELEVTESSLVTDFEKSAAMLGHIRGYGVSVALDDFGTGYSSMAYLKRLPATTLKVDRSFLRGVPESEADCRLLRAMIAMANSLGLRVVVEGVETQAQAQLCCDYGAHALQGYAFSHPLPRRDFEARFARRRRRAMRSAKVS